MLIKHQAREFLKKFEDLHLQFYNSSLKKWTIGYGHPLEGRGLTYEEVKQIFEEGGEIKANEGEVIRYKVNGITPRDFKKLLETTSYPEELIVFSKNTAESILDNDIDHVISTLSGRSYFNEAPENIQTVLICLVFQCGLREMEEKIRTKLGSFDQNGALFIKRIKEKRYREAAEILMKSFVADQTPKRAIQLYKIMV